MAGVVLGVCTIYSVCCSLKLAMNNSNSVQDCRNCPDGSGKLGNDVEKNGAQGETNKETQLGRKLVEFIKRQNEEKREFKLCRGILNPSLDCFMISSIQCFLQLFEFCRNFYMNGDDGCVGKDEDIKYPSENISDKCKISKELKRIIDCYYLEDKKFSLEQFRPLYDKEFPRSSQHDALQFILSLFENIQSEINGDKAHFPSSGYKDCKEAWEQYQKTHTSAIDKLFVGMYESIFKCEECSKEVKVYEEFKTISLYCNQSDPEASFKEFLEHPESTEFSQMMCHDCESIQKCQISKKIVKYPKYMILAFQRLDPIIQTKINGRMHYEEEFTRQCPLVEKDLKYKINSVIIHRGEINYGHYTAICKRGSEWVYFNDSHFKEVAEIINDDAYILFYETDDIDVM
ncbi:unnamed protein product [Moneuplotes crassus]|uniref:USP domain-containing protein n=1 Tax=Euplotes crassus TaxID=5936 RepID=A0AAD1XGX1_EUPCR|nr:unnamed protein product [Moneuplotes crassus]